MSFERRIAYAVQQECDAMVRSTVNQMLHVLECGDVLGTGWTHGLSDVQRQRIRKLRTELVERDVYLLRHGPLPDDDVAVLRALDLADVHSREDATHE